MPVTRRRLATTGLVVLAVLLGSLWAGGGAAGPDPAPAGQLAAGAALPGIEPGAPPDRIPVLRPSAQRPDPGGRLLPLLGGLLAASLTAAARVPGGRRRSGQAPASSPAPTAPRGPRAPPRLQPA